MRPFLPASVLLIPAILIVAIVAAAEPEPEPVLDDWLVDFFRNQLETPGRTEEVRTTASGTYKHIWEIKTDGSRAEVISTAMVEKDGGNVKVTVRI